MENRTNAKDLVKYWARKYQNMIGKPYNIRWMADGIIFKKLLSQYKPQDIKTVIDRAFGTSDTAKYLRSKGYPTTLLPSIFNQLLVEITRPWANIDKYDLDLDTHFSEDYRTEFIWTCVRNGDIHSLVCHIKDEYFFHLLICKIEYQLGYLPEKVVTFYNAWKDKDVPERTSIEQHDEN